ncbi:MAG: hypothetical protein LBF42_00095 [Puniceicoccales bacterium]|jgi:hypothetical protein|nr:hypothetical protein [Puniceicoccales bacterium]
MKNLASLCSILLCACALYGEYPSLCERSPFCEKCVEAVEKQQPDMNGKFEFHGVCLSGNDYLFSILDKGSNKRYWLKFGETLDGICVNRYDEHRQIIELVMPDGSTGNVQLNQFEPKTKAVQLEQVERDIIPISDGARLKFLEVIREDVK